MEMAKADNLEGILKSTEVLAQHPRQVNLAKEIATASSLRGRNRLKKRLTDGKRTRAFREWCRSRNEIDRGDKSFNHRQAHEGISMLHMEDVLKGGANLRYDLEKTCRSAFHT